MRQAVVEQGESPYPIARIGLNGGAFYCRSRLAAPAVSNVVAGERFVNISTSS